MPSTKEINVAKTFADFLRSESDLSTAVAAIKTLTSVLERSTSVGTLQELIDVLKTATLEMKTSEDVECSTTSVTSGCELYLRFITLAHSALEQAQDFNKVREVMLERGKTFTAQLLSARPKIAKLGAPFIQDGWKILVHGRSRTVAASLIEASSANKRIRIYITESGGSDGALMQKQLDKYNFDTTLILDSAVGYIMEKVDCVLVGAEGVVESGGIINKIGTYTIALCAKALNKPLYVMCESFKFVRLYPLNQQDLPNELKYFARTIAKKGSDGNLEYENPTVDFTPPHLITLLFTDLGILTPSAVSDELIKLYL